MDDGHGGSGAGGVVRVDVGFAVVLAALLVVSGLFVNALAQMRRAERIAGYAESERAWLDFRQRVGVPLKAPASQAWALGEEFACPCGRREVVRKGEAPPTCQGVSCVGAEHEACAMRPVAAS